MSRAGMALPFLARRAFLRVIIWEFFMPCMTSYIEIYCSSCKRTLGRYNTKFYNDDKIRDLLKTTHSVHVRDGHTVDMRRTD